jgi:hypothetical protein
MLNNVKTLVAGLLNNWTVITKQTQLVPVKIRAHQLPKW